MSKLELLKEIKGANQDYEWYPTMREIIEAMYWDVVNSEPYSYINKSFLDIGAGNGKVFKVIEEIAEKQKEDKNKFFFASKYAIEKSQVLLNALDEDIYIIGTDFWQQTLIDKKVDIIFSNPPYSQYAAWVEKIIKEANCEHIYLVIPKRWGGNRGIANALKLRRAKVKIIKDFTFENSEDRKARAKVSLIRIDLSKKGEWKYRKSPDIDPFEAWFDEVFQFEIKDNEEDKTEWEIKREKRQKIKELVKGGNLVERLEELYNNAFRHLIDNYKAVSKLDADLLEELGVSVKGLRESLKKKIEGLKHLYWQELFDNMDTITDRLTSKSRKAMLEKLTRHTSVDFNSQNAYAVVIWAIKNANKYFDEQLLEVYYQLSDRDNVRLYRSNKRIIEDGWRYEKRNMSHYSLDYRIVHHFYQAFSPYDWDTVNKLYRDAAVFINDVITIAKNLGFQVTDRAESFYWEPGKKNEFMMANGEVFAEIKAFKNGNIHFKFNKKFMKAFNLEAARLNKWIKSPKEASEEFDISLEEATEMFGKNFTLLPSTMKNLLPSDIEVEEKSNELTEEERPACFAEGRLF
ncbi:DUF4942 domain-containing protein [Nitrosophilus labii]|uniref:DUF4942 domain-containing protein n=1 Tax=Nitrosophilus labii TaxID=2706014 RepID=UPI001656F0B0|nr:DUF4942 domain-containing protein [Nitrosophilus labii]